MLSRKYNLFIFLFILLFSFSCQDQEKHAGEIEIAEGNTPPIVMTDEVEHIKTLLPDLVTSFKENIDEVFTKGEFAHQLDNYFARPDSPQKLETDYDENHFREDLTQLISHFMDHQTPGNNKHQAIYTPNLDVCNDHLAENDPSSCREALARLRIVHDVHAKLQGQLNFYFDTHNPVTITYKDNGLDFNFSFVAIHRILAIVNDIIKTNRPGEEMVNLPTLQGVIRLGVQKHNPDELSLTLDILESVIISWMVRDKEDNKEGMARIEIETANPFATFTSSKMRKNAHLEFDINTIDISFPEINDNEDTKDLYPNLEMKFSLKGITGAIDFNDKDKIVGVSNIAINPHDGHARFSIDQEIAVELDITPFNLTLDANHETFHLETDTGVSAQATINANHAFLEEGFLYMHLQRDSIISFKNIWKENSPDPHTIHQMKSGSLQVWGEQDFNGHFQAITGQCFVDDEDHQDFIFKIIEGCEL